jgi:hypothetical protein
MRLSAIFLSVGGCFLRVFKIKVFARFARNEGLGDKALAGAIADIERGLADADMGGGLIKQRIARAGEGKRGGFRTLIAYHIGKRAIFLFGFAKSDQANISPQDERDLKDFGAMLLALKDKDIELMVENGELREVNCGKEN